MLSTVGTECTPLGIWGDDGMAELDVHLVYASNLHVNVAKQSSRRFTVCIVAVA